MSRRCQFCNKLVRRRRSTGYYLVYPIKYRPLVCLQCLIKLTELELELGSKRKALEAYSKKMIKPRKAELRREEEHGDLPM